MEPVPQLIPIAQVPTAENVDGIADEVVNVDGPTTPIANSPVAQILAMDDLSDESDGEPLPQPNLLPIEPMQIVPFLNYDDL